VSAVEPLPPPPVAPTLRWPAPGRVAFRFLFVYLLLYLLPTVAGVLPLLSYAGQAFEAGQGLLVPAFARHVLRLDSFIDRHPTGSGDTQFNWVSLALFATLAALAAAVWSLATRRRAHPRLYEILRIYVRYGLGVTMVSYGLAKLFPAQFPPIDPPRLMEPYGQFSPMGVVWAFMGTSTAYQIATGIAETAGGVLLFFRRTSSVGALLLLAVLGNVVLLNFCYDVPVKQYSLHLWLMALFLVAPDARPLLDLLVRRRPVQPRPVAWESQPRSRRWRLALRAGNGLLITWLLISHGKQALDGYRQFGAGRPPGPFEGLWAVTELSPGAPPWTRLGLGAWRATVATAQEPIIHYFPAPEQPPDRLTLKRRGQPDLSFSARVHDNALELDGPFHARLVRIERAEVPLLARGFHWVQEYPFNR
jgi:hypothetical protein